MPKAVEPKLSPIHYSTLLAARRHGLFRVDRTWCSKGGRTRIAAATVEALIARGYLDADPLGAKLSSLGRAAVARVER